MKKRASANERTVEDEARVILNHALLSSGDLGLGSFLAEIGREAGPGPDLVIERSKEEREPPDFS